MPWSYTTQDLGCPSLQGSLLCTAAGTKSFLETIMWIWPTSEEILDEQNSLSPLHSHEVLLNPPEQTSGISEEP